MAQGAGLLTQWRYCLRGSNPRHDVQPQSMSSEDTGEGEGEQDEDIRYFVRIGQSDLDGTASAERALSEMNGIGRRTARIICQDVGIDRTATFGGLDEETIETVVEQVNTYADSVPEWLANHRNSYFTGETTHETGNDLEMTRRQDVNRMKMIDSYRGVRHKRGKKVRGQRTKSTGRTEGTVGVNVEAIKEEAAEDE
jgi:small subunit ribosomal protein S13